ncbi:MAG: hypothetical protein ACHQYP_05040 [Nitrospiria bacterium]
MKQFFIFTLVLTFLFVSLGESHAADDKTLENVFKNAYYGAAIGGLLGTAVLIFSDRPADHFDYIAYGLAGGVIAGTFYGMANPPRSLTDIENGRIKLDVPKFEIKSTPQIDPSDRNRAFLFLPLLKIHF